MPSYVITGASRGLGFAFLEKISSNPDNTVIAMVRSPAGTKAKVAELKRPNIHIVQGDLNDYTSLESAVAATSKITGGSLDYLIANAALVKVTNNEFKPFSVQGKVDPAKLETELLDSFKTNVVGNIHLFNVFLPLILKGNVKKVLTITTGLGDIEMARKYNVFENGAYSISKTAVNMAVAKFSAEYAKDGVLFLSVCPGMVDTGLYANISEEDGKGLRAMAGKFAEYQPEFKGPISPEESIKAVLDVMEKASVANGDGGGYYSHLGKGKKWI